MATISYSDDFISTLTAPVSEAASNDRKSCAFSTTNVRKLKKPRVFRGKPLSVTYGIPLATDTSDVIVSAGDVTAVPGDTARRYPGSQVTIVIDVPVPRETEDVSGIVTDHPKWEFVQQITVPASDLSAITAGSLDEAFRIVTAALQKDNWALVRNSFDGYAPWG